MRIAMAFVVLLVAAAAVANPVPNEDIYISFDPAGARVHETTPAPYTTVSAYVVVDQRDIGVNNMTTVSFKLSDPREDFPAVFATAAFVNLLPGNLAIGAWDEGITVSSTECMYAPIVVGRLDCYYLGGPASICIEDHPDYPHWVVDCNDPGVVHLYEMAVPGRISGGDGVCDQLAPVEDVSWGVIKSLYQ